jgi:hypothetical protein
LVGNCQRKYMLKAAKFWTIFSNFGCFLPGRKIQILGFGIRIFLLSHKIRKKIRNPMRGFVSPLQVHIMI